MKIDPNGSNPEILKKLLKEKLVDFAAMDIKTSFENYEELTGVKANLEEIKKSIEIIKNFPEYEFRTTLFPKIKKALELAKKINTARVIINSDTLDINPLIPWGGIKSTSHGGSRILDK